jgi:hypothetical protein
VPPPAVGCLAGGGARAQGAAGRARRKTVNIDWLPAAGDSLRPHATCQSMDLRLNLVVGSGNNLSLEQKPPRNSAGRGVEDRLLPCGFVHWYEGVG